jgi:hypothetical protein
MPLLELIRHPYGESQMLRGDVFETGTRVDEDDRRHQGTRGTPTRRGSPGSPSWPAVTRFHEITKLKAEGKPVAHGGPVVASNLTAEALGQISQGLLRK